MAGMASALEYTPHSNPGRVPTADITQYFLGDELTKLASFISGAPPNLLHDIMSATTTRQATLDDGVRVRDGRLTYPPPSS